MQNKKVSSNVWDRFNPWLVYFTFCVIFFGNSIKVFACPDLKGTFDCDFSTNIVKIQYKDVIQENGVVQRSFTFEAFDSFSLSPLMAQVKPWHKFLGIDAKHTTTCFTDAQGKSFLSFVGPENAPTNLFFIPNETGFIISSSREPLIRICTLRPVHDLTVDINSPSASSSSGVARVGSVRSASEPRANALSVEDCQPPFLLPGEESFLTNPQELPAAREVNRTPEEELSAAMVEMVGLRQQIYWLKLINSSQVQELANLRWRVQVLEESRDRDLRQSRKRSNSKSTQFTSGQ